eukprot:5989628-Ditylum_brightwellii.AAC.1
MHGPRRSPATRAPHGGRRGPATRAGQLPGRLGASRPAAVWSAAQRGSGGGSAAATPAGRGRPSRVGAL